MSLYVAKGSPAPAVPPDLTRRDSGAGELTGYAYDYYGSRFEAVSGGAQVV